MEHYVVNIIKFLNRIIVPALCFAKAGPGLWTKTHRRWQSSDNFFTLFLNYKYMSFCIVVARYNENVERTKQLSNIIIYSLRL